MIAQFGKNYTLAPEKRLSGNELMDLAFEVLERVQHEIGGGVVFLECEDKPKLLEFYQNDKNRFVCILSECQPHLIPYNITMRRFI